MFSFFRARCPLRLKEKVWTEDRMVWLADTFGLKRLLNCALILPSDPRLASVLDGDVVDVARCFEFACQTLTVNVAEFDLELYDAESEPPDSGEYEDVEGDRPLVRVPRFAELELDTVLSGMARRVAKHLLITEGTMSTSDEDFASVADLLLTYTGLGIFMANTAIHETIVDTGLIRNSYLSKTGYLSSRVHAYALAMFATMRNEEPTWSAFLRLDVSEVLTQSMRFLTRSDDCLFHPRVYRPDRPEPDPTDMVDLLRRGTDTQKLVTLWDISSDPPDRAIDEVVGCLHHREAAVREAALTAFSAYGSRTEEYLSDLLYAACDSDELVQSAAAVCLIASGSRDPEVVTSLEEILDGGGRERILAATAGLSRLGPEARDTLPTIRRFLLKSLAECDEGNVVLLAQAIFSIADDPQEIFASVRSPDDKAYNRMLDDAIELCQSETSSHESHA